MILVTGGTGMVGSHLLANLLKAKKEVKALIRKGSLLDSTKKIFSYYFDEDNNPFEKIHWIEGDLLDYQSLSEALENVDYVYHCAATVSFHSSMKDKIHLINVNGTSNLVNLCLEKKVKKFCHISSIATLGREKDELFITENTHWTGSSKKSMYSISKFGAEREVWRAHAEGLNVVIVNPSIILGAGDWNKGSVAMISTMWNGLKFYTNGINGYVDVRDVVKAMIMLMESNISGERFILNAENMSYKDIFILISNHLGIHPPKYHAGKFLSGLAWRFEKVKELISGKEALITRETARTACSSYRYSSEKIENQTGFTFIPIEETIKYVCEKFKSEL